MKADAGSWLYIILSIVFLIISAVGNKNKKKPYSAPTPDNEDYETPSVPQERNWPKSFEDVLNEVLEVPKPKEVIVEKPQPKKIEVPQDNPYFSYEKIEDEAQSLETLDQKYINYEAPEEENKNKKPVYQPIVLKQEVKIPKEAESQTNVPEFDLKQGIIYAEILNRKYF